MATDRWATTYTVPADPTTVYRHLVNPNSYVGLSPLVIAVRQIQPDTDEHGRPRVAYVAVERFRFARILRWDNPIKVVLTQTQPDREFVSEVRSPGGVQLTARVALVPRDGATEVTEAVDVSFPAPLRRLVTGQARAVAAYRAEELTRRMSRH